MTDLEIELSARIVLLEHEVQTQRRHADRWQELAGRYDDIREWLRICEDTRDGHAEFYTECSKLIFGNDVHG